MPKQEEYEHITVEIDCGTLLIKSKLKGNHVTGQEQHDEDVSDWTKPDILRCVKGLLDLTTDEVKLVKIVYL